MILLYFIFKKNINKPLKQYRNNKPTHSNHRYNKHNPWALHAWRLHRLSCNRPVLRHRNVDHLIRIWTCTLSLLLILRDSLVASHERTHLNKKHFTVGPTIKKDAVEHHPFYSFVVYHRRSTQDIRNNKRHRCFL